MRRVIALAAWGFLAWGLLTWTFTLEQMLFGAVIAVAVAACLAPLGEVRGPWWILHPRRLLGLVRLALGSAWRILVANVNLAARVWNPRLPLSSGMVIVPTQERSDGALAAVGLISSLIVDNQITDLDRARHLLQYHAVSVPQGGREQARETINGPIERLLEPLTEPSRPHSRRTRRRGPVR